MNNEIRKKIDAATVDIVGIVHNGLMTMEQSRKFDKAMNRLASCITSLETELAALKAELTQYEWQSGHPEHENEVFVCVKRFDEVCEVYKYETDEWQIKDGIWKYHNGERVDVLAWSEIRPWKGE